MRRRWIRRACLHAGLDTDRLFPGPRASPQATPGAVPCPATIEANGLRLHLPRSGACCAGSEVQPAAAERCWSRSAWGSGHLDEGSHCISDCLRWPHDFRPRIVRGGGSLRRPLLLVRALRWPTERHRVLTRRYSSLPHPRPPPPMLTHPNTEGRVRGPRSHSLRPALSHLRLRARLPPRSDPHGMSLSPPVLAHNLPATAPMRRRFAAARAFAAQAQVCLKTPVAPLRRRRRAVLIYPLRTPASPVRVAMRRAPGANLSASNGWTRGVRPSLHRRPVMDRRGPTAGPWQHCFSRHPRPSTSCCGPRSPSACWGSTAPRCGPLVLTWTWPASVRGATCRSRAAGGTRWAAGLSVPGVLVPIGDRTSLVGR